SSRLSTPCSGRLSTQRLPPQLPPQLLRSPRSRGQQVTQTRKRRGLQHPGRPARLPQHQSPSSNDPNEPRDAEPCARRAGAR
ncbi:MAG: hypothetical protein BJ554DRAFT_932, partial [Olpidium bornovanus]